MYDLNFKPPNNLQICHDFFQHQNMAFCHFFLPFFVASLFFHHQVSMPIARRLTPWHPRPTTQNLVLNTSVSDFLSIILTPPENGGNIYIYILYWEMIRKNMVWETTGEVNDGKNRGKWTFHLLLSARPEAVHWAYLRDLGILEQEIAEFQVRFLRPRSCRSEQLKIRTCLRTFRKQFQQFQKSDHMTSIPVPPIFQKRESSPCFSTVFTHTAKGHENSDLTKLQCIKRSIGWSKLLLWRRCRLVRRESQNFHGANQE